jgi:Fe-S-cluster containining protein
MSSKSRKSSGSEVTRIASLSIDLDSGMLEASLDGGDSLVVDLTRKVGADCVEHVEALVALCGKKKSTAVEDNCMECVGACCTEWRINIDMADVERLAKGTGREVDDLINEHVDPSFDYSGGDRVYQLRHVADDRFEGKTRCKFLSVQPATAKKNAVGRCSVYEHRPKTCREFPAHSCEQFVPASKLRRGDLPVVDKA